jgi:predicted AlkP superfamily pyrophosphatase or phosphodiesterase
VANAKKLVLVVIDGFGRPLFDRALAEGRAPTLSALLAQGTVHPPTVSCFPSLTPVCLSAIATGRGPDGSFIPSLVWYHRGERRFVEYGSSFKATLVEGTLAFINDSIMNLNHLHLSQRERTLFELVEDAGLVAGSINWFVFRGRVRHALKHRRALPVARRIGMFDAAYGPSRFFFGELFASDVTGAPGNLGMHGKNDEHAAAVGQWLVARDGFDFLLYYLPEVDMAQHRVGPDAALDAVERADTSVRSLVDAAGGLERFLDRYAVIFCADHGQTQVRETFELRSALPDLPQFVSSLRSSPDRSAIAVSASNRAAMVYRLTDAPPSRAIAARLEELPQIDVVAFDEDGWHVARRAGEEVRFRLDAGGELDARGGHWALAGEPGALGLERAGGLLRSAAYPNALERLHQILTCVNAGEVVASAAPGVELADAGGSHHLGGGSHGGLGADESLVPLATVGVERVSLPDEPSITDVYGLVARHFGLD